jgi:hypothetical protein
MLSSRERRGLSFAAIVVAATAFASGAGAQQQPQGFAVERFYPSAPGGGWFVMDDLDMHGGLGGVMALTAGYAMKPLRVSDGSQHLAVVSDRAFTDFGLAVTYERWRLYVNLEAPLLTKGQSGTVGDYQFAAPSLDLGTAPDTLTDARIALDARVIGRASSSFRLGVGAQLFVPNGLRSYTDVNQNYHASYDTDGSYRAMGRVLFAGDVGVFTYAGHAGVHVRPLDDSPTPGSPQGSELLFGAAAGARFPVFGNHAIVVGPEIYGATAFRAFMQSTGTALEALFTGRLEGTADDGPQLRFKLGMGAGLNPHFGAPGWRLVFGIELSDRTARQAVGIPRAPQP